MGDRLAEDLADLLERRESLVALSKQMDAPELAQAIEATDAELARVKTPRKPAAPAVKLATRDYVDAVIAAFAKSLAPILKQQTSPLKAEIAKLQERITALEARPIKYCGTWEQKVYLANSIVSRDGSMFIAREDTAQRPGDGVGWTLCVKRGRDGKDLR